MRCVGFELSTLHSYRFYMEICSTNFRGNGSDERMVQFQNFFDTAHVQTMLNNPAKKKFGYIVNWRSSSGDRQTDGPTDRQTKRAQ